MTPKITANRRKLTSDEAKIIYDIKDIVFNKKKRTIKYPDKDGK
jgi:hypothetical protein